MTDKLRAAAQAALEALEYLESQPHVRGKDDCYEDLIAEIRAALDEPPREWQGLADEELSAAWASSKGDVVFRLLPFARAIESKLKEKNHD